MDRYPPRQDGAFHHPATAGGHGAKRRWQPGNLIYRRERRSFLSNARTREARP